MENIGNSELLNKILVRAEALCKENECGTVTRDYVIIAAMNVLDGEGYPDQATEEYFRTRVLLSGISRKKELIENVLRKWRGKEVPIIERIILSKLKKQSLYAAEQAGRTQLTADAFLSTVLRECTPAIIELQAGQEGPDQNPLVEEDFLEDSVTIPETLETDQPASMRSIIQSAKQLQSGLQETVLGQQHAVSVFASGYFQSELQANISKDRKRPRATFLFAGPPGVGKTFLSEEAARVLKLPFRRFDMSEYTGQNAPDELSGSDANYKASSEGLLTGFVSRNPRCLLLFDEIEKADIDVIHLFLQILDAGRIRDNKTDIEVSFKDTILIFTTNAGKVLYENEDNRNLSSVSREVILDALANDINPKTKEPYFPAAICSRFAAGNVVMFNHLEADSLRLIVERELARQTRDISDAMGITVTIDRDVTTALLLAEGAMADARSVKSRAGSFFGGELYELFRLVSSNDQYANVENIKDIHVSINKENEAEDMLRLFSPAKRIHAVAYSKECFGLAKQHNLIPVIHYVQNAEQAQKVMEKEDIRLVFCDLFCDKLEGKKKYLNLEDRDTEGRRFLRYMLGHYPTLPVVLTEPEGHSFTEEERISYLRNGVRGFLPLAPDTLEPGMARYTESIFQQHNMTELARGNKLLHFETAQSIAEDGQTAEIVLFDLKLDKAIKAEDAGNVMSLLSTPDVKFDDVIGADEAKDELRFFISYMKNPKEYRRSGVSAPKGVLLYGPPGTGKTMLAKAFAAESNATFIATEGNQFFKGIVGQGAAMVHRLFATARRYAPSVIFIDEIDTIARARTGRDTDMAQDSEQILTALFAEMDGFSTQPDKPVFVLGATNYRVEPGTQMSIDPAMLRRFDRRILVDLPNLENRKKYLNREIKKKSILHLSDDTVASLADRSTGMSLAQLASVLDMAIRNAAQKQKEYVDDLTMENAFDTFNSGEARKWDAETTLKTARHEAGHALVSWLSGEKPSFITIVSRGDYGGYMQYADRDNRMGYTKQELLGRIRTALGGRAAEIVYYGEEGGLSTGASGDLKSATAMAEQMLCRYGMDEQFGLAVIERPDGSVSHTVQAHINSVLKDQLSMAIQQIRENKGRMDTLVDELLKSNSLRSADIDKLMADVKI